MDDDYIPQPRPRLSDEAAAHFLDFLYELVANFESAYTGQILRHRHEKAKDYCDRRQLPLFADHKGDPF